MKLWQQQLHEDSRRAGEFAEYLEGDARNLLRFSAHFMRGAARASLPLFAGYLADRRVS